MYDHNPFREAKKIYENMSPEEIAAYKKQLGAMIDPIGAKYGNPMAQNRERMRADLAKKRKDHEEMVRKGELTQAEFDRLEKLGEFDIKEGIISEGEWSDHQDAKEEQCIKYHMDRGLSKEEAIKECTEEEREWKKKITSESTVKEGKSFEDMEDCVQFYMDAKDYDRKAAENECRNGRHTFSEAAEREYDDFDIGPQVEEMPGAEDYEAKMENDKHEAMIKDKLMGFLNKKPHDPVTKRVHHEMYRARIHANPHEQDSSVVRVAGQTFIVPHGHSPHIKVVS